MRVAGEGPVKKVGPTTSTRRQANNSAAPADGYIMHRAKSAPAAKGDTFRMGGATFVNNGTASAEVYARVEQLLNASS